MTKVLIVEDDDTIAEGMAQHLAAAGLDPMRVGAGEVGLARLRHERPDVLVLDLMLPGLDGWSLIEQARAEGIGTPILVVSARGTEHDRVHALQIGADDYLVKPFSMKELVARVEAAARRGVRGLHEDRGEELVIEELRIDPRSVQAFVDGENAELTPTEFRLLYALAQDRSCVGLAERDDLPPLLELAQEEDVVDEVGHLPYLLARPCEERLEVGTGELGRIEQRLEARERRPQLVRDRSSERRTEGFIVGVSHYA